jgi:hypothetical protein
MQTFSRELSGSVAIAKSWALFVLLRLSQCLRGPTTKIQGTVCTMEDGAALSVVKLYKGALMRPYLFNSVGGYFVPVNENRHVLVFSTVLSQS